MIAESEKKSVRTFRITSFSGTGWLITRFVMIITDTLGVQPVLERTSCWVRVRNWKYRELITITWNFSHSPKIFKTRTRFKRVKYIFFEKKGGQTYFPTFFVLLSVLFKKNEYRIKIELYTGWKLFNLPGVVLRVNSLERQKTFDLKTIFSLQIFLLI